ncbi:SusC/RagA family TonB-linked outer membrane protein [Mucilaginibacter sp. BJC16-A38]|uniref:SusC/RagA family TonB-linked outer membrane protein n=1 Tax=Mucilaginibacter phenanthrenivorans TaxID=1234842 RepID=UPI0021587104|nr:SusC/RagA family TonB-linked outer membrane protein [Mucilaginibacter phenanthrenivorans]MCR8559876.1 SusC/RagA family TonB-linked outer membrane protein [Mucilaginibacter phenanthrenivorans]
MRKNYSKKYVLLCAFLMLSAMAFAQTGSIKGKVIDETNQPLPGSSISIDGTTTGTVTDAGGNYTITGLKPGNYTVTAKFLGYIALNKTVTVSTSVVTIDFALKPANNNLNEVVVVGYGTQRKKDLTGSVVSVSSKDFNQGPITTPEALITGKVSGVEITSNSGAPGAGSTIRIRGGASITASNDPLIVIDGVPISNSGIPGIDNPLATINPNDIESYNILKDASATAIYGSRASNGVIIVTTKKGKGNEPFTVNFSSLNSLSKITKEAPSLTAAQFRSVVNSPQAGLTDAQKAQMGTSNTDWQSLIYRQAFSTDNNISFTGGVKGLPYRLAIGYLDQDGVLKRDNLKRTTVALNLNHDFLRNSLKVDFNLKGTYTDRHFANQSAIGAAVGFDPTQPVYSGNQKYGGYFEWLDVSGNGNPSTLAPRNPLGLLNEQQARGTTKRGLGSLSLNYIFPFLKELQANATFGGDITDGQGQTFVPATAAASFAQKGSFSQYFGENYTYNTDYYLKYAKDFKEIKSHLDVQAGYSYQYFHFYTKPYASYAADKTTVTSAAAAIFPGQYYIESPFGRLNFNYNDEFLLTATIRDDRSSKFSNANRNGYFPSVALAWRLKQEDFLKGVDFVSDLKLRGSYGVTGQQDIGPNFAYLAVYDPSNIGAQYQFGGSYINTLRPDAYNTNIKWESTATSNLAIDYGFLNGKINGSLEYYYKKTKDLLFDTPVPDGTNLTNHVIANIGNLHTKGIDFNINVNAITTQDINWTVGYNISYNKITVDNISATHDPNQIIQVGGIPGGVGNTIQLLKAGYTPYQFYVYQQVYGSNGMPLNGVYVDRNGNGSSSDDKYLYKQPNPSVFMGFNSNLNYKKWNLGFTLRANLGNYVYNAVQASNGAYAGLKFQGYLNNIPNSILKTNFSQYQLYSDYYVENASFLRMDNANLTYNFGKIAGAASLRITGNVQNVFVVTKYTGLDPEVSTGIDNNIYPRPRVYSLGVNVTF